MKVLEEIIEELGKEKLSKDINVTANHNYREGYIKALSMAQTIVSKHITQPVEDEKSDKVVVEILDGIADWWYTETPMNDEPESETCKTLQKVHEYVETFLSTAEKE